MEIGNIEGMIALILEHYIAHFDLQQKIDHLFFMKLHSLKSECFGSFSEGFKSGSSQVF